MGRSISRDLMVLFALATLAGCSMDNMIDTMTLEEERAMAQEFVENIRTGNSAKIEVMVDPEIWRNSANQFEEAAGLFPNGNVERRLTSYSIIVSGSEHNSIGLREGARTEPPRFYWRVFCLRSE